MTPLADTSTAAARFRHRVRVYWEDTDAGGVVYYANYLKFFERARTEWLRSLGIGQHDLRARTGAVFIVVDTALRFVQPARLDDLLDVTVDLGERRPATLVVAQQAWRDGALLCSGEIRIGCVDSGTFRPRRIPSEITSRL
jgi:acyl-CoA thioester hydrolase